MKTKAQCFLEGLRGKRVAFIGAGVSHRDPAIVRACEFLLSKQRLDGDPRHDVQGVGGEEGIVARGRPGLLHVEQQGRRGVG